MTALHVCAGKADSDWIHRALAAGGPVDATDVEGATALHLAFGHAANVKALLEAGAAINARDGDGRTTLGRAIRDRDFEMALLLLEAGALTGDSGRASHW
jgi:ankyrin repeat protein